LNLVRHQLQVFVARIHPATRQDPIVPYFDYVVRMITPILQCGEREKHWLAVATARAVAAGRMPPLIDGQTASIAVVNEPVPATANKTSRTSSQLRGSRSRTGEF